MAEFSVIDEVRKLDERFFDCPDGDDGRTFRMLTSHPCAVRTAHGETSLLRAGPRGGNQVSKSIMAVRSLYRPNP
jgi:hypothetical protein